MKSLKEACRTGDLEEVERLFEEDFDNVALNIGYCNCKCKYCRLSINNTREELYLEAIENGHLHILKFLDRRFMTPLNKSIPIAAYFGQFEIIKHLVEEKKLHKRLDSWNDLASILASERGDLELIQYFYEHDMIQKEVQLPIFAAVEHGQVEVLKYLLEKFDVNYEKFYKLAIRFNQLEIVKFLLGCQTYSYSNVNYAILWGSPEMTLLLIEHGAQPTVAITKKIFYEHVLEVIRRLKVTQRFHPYLILEILERRYSALQNVDKKYLWWYTSRELFSMINS